MSHLTGMSLSLSGWREQEGSYACKNQADIHVQQGELFHKARLKTAANICTGHKSVLYFHGPEGPDALQSLIILR